MGLRRPTLRHRIQPARRPHHEDVAGTHPHIVLGPTAVLEDEIEREAVLKGRGGVDLVHLVVAEFDAERLDVGLEVRNLAPADDGEDVGRLVPHVRQRDARDQGPLCPRESVEDHGDLLRVLGLAHFAPFGFALVVLGAHEGAAAQGAPGRQRHAFGLAHGDDVALEVAHGGAPEALVDAEGGEALLAGVLVGLADDPGRGVADAQVEHLAADDEVVQRLHDLGDRGGKVPPVDVEQVDVGRAEFPQARFEGDAQALGGVAEVVGLDGHGLGGVGRREFGGEDDLVAVPARLHPFAEPLLVLFVLVVVRRVDEVAAVVDKVVEHPE